MVRSAHGGDRGAPLFQQATFYVQPVLKSRHDDNVLQSGRESSDSSSGASGGSGAPRDAKAGAGAKRGRKRKKRDPDAPKPARFAWNFFFKERYTEIRNQAPEGHHNVQRAFTQIGYTLGQEWKNLSDEQRAPYMTMAAKDRQRYESELREYEAGLAAARKKVVKDSSPADDGAPTGTAVSSAAAATPDDSAAHTRDIGQGEAARGDESDDDGADLDDDEDAVGDKVDIVVHEVEVVDGRSDEEKNATAGDIEGRVYADVLVVDDDDVFIKIIKHRLVLSHMKSHGRDAPPLRIVTVKDGESAVKLVADEGKKFDTVIMDKEMGEDHVDGASAVRMLRERGYGGYIVGVSAKDANQESFRDSGADDFVYKGSKALYEDLHKLVDLHHQEAAKAAASDDSLPNPPQKQLVFVSFTKQ